MSKENNYINFEIRELHYSGEYNSDCQEALRIYRDSTPYDVFTASCQLEHYMENPLNDSGNRRFYFFGLYCDAELIGFAELAYVVRTRILVLDYLSFKKQYKSKNVVFPLLNLILEYLSGLDYSYVIAEVSRRNHGKDIDSDSLFFLEMLATDGFYIARAPYYHPILEDNFESDFKAILLIKPRSNVMCMQKMTYLDIVNDIYFTHYLDGYKPFLGDVNREKRYYKHLNAKYKKICFKMSCRFKVKMVEASELSKHAFPISGMTILSTILSFIVAVVVAFLLYYILINTGIPIEDFTPLLLGCSVIVSSGIIKGLPYILREVI